MRCGDRVKAVAHHRRVRQDKLSADVTSVASASRTVPGASPQGPSGSTVREAGSAVAAHGQVAVSDTSFAKRAAEALRDPAPPKRASTHGPCLQRPHDGRVVAGAGQTTWSAAAHFDCQRCGARRCGRPRFGCLPNGRLPRVVGRLREAAGKTVAAGTMLLPPFNCHDVGMSKSTVSKKAHDSFEAPQEGVCSRSVVPTCNGRRG